MVQCRHFACLCLFLTVTFLGLAGTLSAQDETLSEINRDIAGLLQRDDLNIRGVEILTQGVMREVYRDHDFAPYWTKPGRIRELMGLIENAEEHGLVPADYNVALLYELMTRIGTSPTAQLVAEEDILLTESLLRYGYHRRFGKVKANKLDPDINYRRETFQSQSPTMTVEEALESSSLAAFIQMAAPSGPVYGHLQAVLSAYRTMAKNGGWPEVPAGPTVRKGDRDSRVAAIRARLSATGELSQSYGVDPEYFDGTLEMAVKDFQAGHALDDDGVVGKNTILAMNVPVGYRIDQLRLSLERLRWVNQEAADTLVAVNIAGFRAFFYEEGELKWSTRAMVGKHYRKTPVFRGDISYLEFNPTWTIPPGILRNDTLPAIKKDPGYLNSKNIRVIDQSGKIIDPLTVDWNQYSRGVPYTLRQDPGPWNSLGTVKFIFPNEHFVFLHDTPHRELFSRAERAFSSGCIRIENPLNLAELILNDPQQYPHSRLVDIVDSRETIRVNLETKVPVLILYLTASVDPDGEVRFYKDIYERDQKVLDALNGPVIIDLPEV